MPTANSWNDLTNIIGNKISSALKNEVFEEVRDVIQEHIQSDVYDAYSPTEYVRREFNDGLIADENIIYETSLNTSLEVIDIAKPNNPFRGSEYMPSNRTKFSEWIEYGQVYNFNNSDDAWTQPRPFIKNTIDDLAQNQQHLSALSDGLKRQGLKIK